jgi:hypothetical protein
LILHPRFFLDKSRETTGTIAAHIGCAAIVIVKFPRPIRLAGARGHKHQQTIRADAALAVTNPHHLFRAELNCPLPIIDQHKVISRTVHLGKPKHHRKRN